MGTRVHFIAYTGATVDEAATRQALDDAYAEIVRLEGLMSPWKPDSELSRINRAAGKPVQVGQDTWNVVWKSLWASERSLGTFDISFAAMNGVWKFGDAAEKDPKLPDPKLIDERRALIDWRKIHVNSKRHTVQLGAGMSIDLGGIAKGYAVDRAVAVLKQAGVTDFLAQAGGDLYGSGRKPDGSPWVSGVQDPRGPEGKFFATLDLTDHAFSTAGDYARSFVLGGKRYHHIIDPRTGWPATACRSVTVWAEDAFTADAIDDAIFILGPEKGLALVESVDGAGAVIVDAQNRVHVSKRIARAVKTLAEPTDGS